MIFFDERFRKLSDAERRTLRDLASGMAVNEIALHRSISLHTVRSQLHNLFLKLGVSSQAQAVALYYKCQGKVEVRRSGMFFEVDKKGKLYVINGYPDPERNVQNLAAFFPDSIFFYAELTTEE